MGTPVDACVDRGDQNNVEVTFRAGCPTGVPPGLPSLSKAMAVKPEEGERGAEKYLREVMGVVEEKEQQRKTRRKEAEQEGGKRSNGCQTRGGQARKQEEEVKKRRQKLKVEKVLV